MPKLNCLVVDDDPLVCETVESFLHRLDDTGYCLKAHDGMAAVALLASGELDAAFLDLQLPGLEGVDVLKTLPPELPVVIISASDSFGAQSYEFNVVDYLVKPLEFERFSQAWRKVRDTLARRRSDAAGKPAGTDSGVLAGQDIFIKDGTRLVKISLDRLICLKAESNYVEFITEEGSVLSLISMKRLEELLPPEFIRIHRSYMVNLRHLKKVEDGVVHAGRHRLPVGQSYRESLFEKLPLIN